MGKETAMSEKKDTTMLEEKVEAVSALLKAISHPLRLKILCQLQDGEKTVGDIQAAVQTTNANVSQHLTKLRHQDIITFRKDANFIYNRIADERVVDLVNTMQNLFC
jgi:ArsR family transcriptional regulator